MPANKLLIAATTCLLGFAVTFGSCKRAHAKPKGESCAGAYESAQELRKRAKLQRAQEMLLLCARESCGKFMHGECRVWLEQLQQEMPSVIVSAKDSSGAPLHDVQVSLDGMALTPAPNGAAVSLDPGLHEFRFNAEGHAEVLHEVDILPGQQNQPLEVRFAREEQHSVKGADTMPAREVAVDDSATGSSRSSVPYVVGGVGVLGVVGFGVFGALAKNEHAQLRQCSVDCSRAQVERVSTLYAVANVSFGVGVVGLGTAAVLLLTSRDSSEASRSRPSSQARLEAIDVRQTRGGAFAELRGSF
jgi:hypothetical protein